uniref:Uncharacterized protein n=1 Tax=Amphimedon queenslandica TaxID=400682 RepID=A0A1X7T9F3_AMPQE
MRTLVPLQVPGITMHEAEYKHLSESDISWKCNPCNRERTNRNPLNFQSAVWFNFGSGKKVVDGTVIEVEHRSEKRGKHPLSTLNALYMQYPLPIRKAKAEDVSKLASKYVPAHLQGFYANLPTIDDGTVDSDDD